MRMSVRRAALVSALAIGVVLVTSGPAGVAGAASIGSSAPVAPAAVLAARTAAAGALGNYRISGDEDAIGCLTAHRCVAVGFGGGRAPAQVVAVVGGKQVRVSVVRAASNLVAVSCPDRFGCWAMGPPRKGQRSWKLVKISRSGGITGVTSARLPAGVVLSSISCTSMTACEVFGVYTDYPQSGSQQWYLAAWNGSQLSHPTVAGANNGSEVLAEGVSCWQATCVAVGAQYCPGSSGCFWRYGIMTTSSGKLEPSHALNIAGTFGGVSCVSSATCYAATSNGVVTLEDGAVAATESDPDGGSSIECAGTTCWAAGNADGVATFVLITSGMPTGTPLIDPAVAAPSVSSGQNWPAIARRGSGFAAVGGAAVNGGPRVSEVVTN